MWNSLLWTKGNIFKAGLQADKGGAIRSKLVGKSEKPVDAKANEYKFFDKEKALYINVYRNQQLSYDINEELNRGQYKGTENLIIDLRNHSGGSFHEGNKLVTSIKGNSTLNRQGHLFVITGRDTFSSGVLLALDFKRNTNAIFYGEPTGGKPEHYGEVRNFKLPNSKMVIRYSTKFFAAERFKTDSLYPDVEVDNTIADYLNGEDPVVRRILDSIN